MNSKVEMLERIGVLIAGYPNTQVADDTISLYVRMLGDIPLDLLDATVEQCLAESKFFPSVAELREKAFALSSTAGSLMAGWEAWGEVVKQIHAVGFYGQPSFKCPILAKAVEIIGWRELCTSENTVADRAHFVKIYDQLVNRAIQDAKLLPASREMMDRVLNAPDQKALSVGDLVSKMEM